MLAALFATACVPTRFAIRGENTYWLHKLSSACVLGTEAGIHGELWMEAARFCAARKEAPEIISSTFEYGIPYIRCASLEIEFRCIPEALATKTPSLPDDLK